MKESKNPINPGPKREKAAVRAAALWVKRSLPRKTNRSLKAFQRLTQPALVLDLSGGVRIGQQEFDQELAEALQQRLGDQFATLMRGESRT